MDLPIATGSDSSKKKWYVHVYVLLLLIFVFLGELWFYMDPIMGIERLLHPSAGICDNVKLPLQPRPHSVSIKEFGAVGDGVTLNTHAFQNAIFYLSSFAKNGGGQLYVPAGKWLTGSFNLTSHLTLYLEKNAVIMGSQDFKQWPVIEPLPSYGRGRELPGGRHSSLIYGVNLTDVIITGENGTIDGQGSVWWDAHQNGTLDHTRGPLLELVDSKDIIITNLTFQNSPYWTIHPIYSRNIYIQNVTILAPTASSNTDGINPDSSSDVCIQDCYINNGDDIIAIKSGWDEYGIAFNRPSKNIMIRNVVGSTRSSAGFSIGSEMSGGVSDVYVHNLVVLHAQSGIRIKTAPGRGGYVRNIHISNVTLFTVRYGITLHSHYNEHPDDRFDPAALSSVEKIHIENIIGKNITYAGRFQGFSANNIFKNISLSNISFNVTSPLEHSWECSFVQGSSVNVFPIPCVELQT